MHFKDLQQLQQKVELCAPDLVHALRHACPQVLTGLTQPALQKVNNFCVQSVAAEVKLREVCEHTADLHPELSHLLLHLQSVVLRCIWTCFERVHCKSTVSSCIHAVVKQIVRCDHECTVPLTAVRQVDSAQSAIGVLCHFVVLCTGTHVIEHNWNAM